MYQNCAGVQRNVGNPDSVSDYIKSSLVIFSQIRSGPGIRFMNVVNLRVRSEIFRMQRMYRINISLCVYLIFSTPGNFLINLDQFSEEANENGEIFKIFGPTEKFLERKTLTSLINTLPNIKEFSGRIFYFCFGGPTRFLRLTFFVTFQLVFEKIKII